MNKCIYNRLGRCLKDGSVCFDDQPYCENHKDIMGSRMTSQCDLEYADGLKDDDKHVAKLSEILCKLQCVENEIEKHNLIVFPRMFMLENSDWIVEYNSPVGVRQKTFLLEEDAIKFYKKMKNNSMF